MGSTTNLRGRSMRLIAASHEHLVSSPVRVHSEAYGGWDCSPVYEYAAGWTSDLLTRETIRPPRASGHRERLRPIFNRNRAYSAPERHSVPPCVPGRNTVNGSATYNQGVPAYVTVSASQPRGGPVALATQRAGGDKRSFPCASNSPRQSVMTFLAETFFLPEWPAEGP